ncbi:MAG: transposase [Chloroflexi bacterium]|nr:transposase [Chloroflexota bacterium]
MSCHRFVANLVRLSLFILAYNLGNFPRRLCLPKAVRHWSLRSVQVKLIKMGGRLVRHSRRLIIQLSEVSVPRLLSKECWIVSAGYHRHQTEGEYNDDYAERESARGSLLVSNALSPHWRGPEDDKDGQEEWFTARNAFLIG